MRTCLACNEELTSGETCPNGHGDILNDIVKQAYLEGLSDGIYAGQTSLSQESEKYWLASNAYERK